MKYIPRVVDTEIKELMEIMGAVLIEGCKWCGKSTTGAYHSKSIIEFQNPDKKQEYETIKNTKPSLFLNGEKPRMFDEWQMYPVVWDSIRTDVDHSGKKGQYILTGSAKPSEGATMHSGTGRISRLLMRPMSLYESGESTGEVSFFDILEGKDISGNPTHYETSLTWVKDITIDEYGTVHFVYTDQEDTIYKNFLKWIKDVTLDAETGLFTINYNYDKTRDGEEKADTDTQYQTYLRFMKNVVIDEDGTIHLEYSHGEEQTFTRYIKTVKEMTLDTETGHFEVTYNQEQDKDDKDTKYETDLRWVKQIDVAEDGTIDFTYTYGGNETYTKYLKVIKDISLNTEDGTFTITYNQDTDKDGNPTKYQVQLDWVKNLEMASDGTITLIHTTGERVALSDKVKWVKNITVNTGQEEGSGNQKIAVTYNNDITEEIGNPINYIMQTAMTPDRHLAVLYSDPSKRAEIVAAKKNITFEGRNDWLDLGVIKGESGIYVGLNLSTEDHPELTTSEKIIEYLNTAYPNGLTGTDLEGKIVTVGDTADYKLFYAFDYSYDENQKYKGWYYLGSIGGSTGIVVGKEGDSSTEALVSQLPTNGVWFIAVD